MLDEPLTSVDNDVGDTEIQIVLSSRLPEE